MGTFVAEVSSLSDIHRREQNLPSSIRMKQINTCWLKIIKILREMLSELDDVKIKRGYLFLKLIDLTKDLDGPNLLMDTIFMSKEKLFEQLEVLKLHGRVSLPTQLNSPKMRLKSGWSDTLTRMLILRTRCTKY